MRRQGDGPRPQRGWAQAREKRRRASLPGVPGLRSDDGTPKRNGGRHCCRPPLSLVPLVLPEGETAFPREVPAEASRPRSVPQVPSQDHCWSGSGSCGFRAQPCGRLRIPGGFLPSEALRLPNSGSLSDSDEAKLPRRPFAKPSARGLPVSPDPRRKVGSALACAAASRFFLPVARDLRFDWLPSEDFGRSPRGHHWERHSVSGGPRPATSQ